MSGRFGGKCNSPGHLSCEQMNQPSIIFMAAGIERRKRRPANLLPLRVRLDADVSKHDATASMHGGKGSVGRLQGAEGYRKVERRHVVQFAPTVRLDATRQVAGDP